MCLSKNKINSVVVPTNEDTRISVDSTLRARTVISKFKVAESLALMGVTFLFWEMDVFIFKYPEPILASLSDTNVDIIVSAHQVSLIRIFISTVVL